MLSIWRVRRECVCMCVLMCEDMGDIRESEKSGKVVVVGGESVAAQEGE